MDASPVVSPPHVAGPLRLDAFRGLALAPRRVGDPGSARAFARPYRDVAGRLARWQASGQVVRDDEPAVYLHEYSAAGITVRGLVGALDVSRRAHQPEDRVVLPHEGVHPGQVTDLADRMAEMQLNPAPILLVHRATDEVRATLHDVASAAPDRAFADRAEHRHRVWAIRDVTTLSRLADGLAGSRAVIADGHHRYAAYLKMQERAPGTGADHGLAMLVDQADTPLHAGAIHRALRGPTVDEIRLAAEDVATVHEGPREETLQRLGPATIVVTDGRRWLALELGGIDDRTSAVEVLHGTLLPRLTEPPRRIDYHHSVEAVLAHLPTRRGVAVLMPAADVDTIARIVRSGRLLPEKATSFQPKPSLGVLMRSLLDG